MANSGSWEHQPFGMPDQDPLDLFGLLKYRVRIGDGNYAPSDFLPFLENLIVEIEGIHIDVTDLSEPSLSEEEESFCIENFGRVPGKAFRETKIWKTIKQILSTKRETLHQKICVKMNYCKRKGNIPIAEILATLGEFFPPTPEAEGITKALAAIWFFFSFSIEKLCRCE